MTSSAAEPLPALPALIVAGHNAAAIGCGSLHQIVDDVVDTWGGAA